MLLRYTRLLGSIAGVEGDDDLTRIEGVGPGGCTSRAGRHADPRGRPLLLSVEPALVAIDLPKVARNGPFVLELPLPPAAPGDTLRLTLRCADPFVPAEVEPGSTDCRALAFLFEAASLRA